MTTTLATTRTRNNGPSHPRRPNSLNTRSRRIPMTRLIAVELRKSFDTRSGLALLAGIAASAVLTTTAVIAFAPHQEFTYSQFSRAIGFPMSIILPIIAVLSVTAEWSQRSGLTTFWLVPHRGRVLLAKASAVVLVAVAATPVAFGVGALGNLLGTVDTGAAAVMGRPTRRRRRVRAGQRTADGHRVHPRRPGPRQRSSHRRLHGLRVHRPHTAHLPGHQPDLVP